MVARSWLTLFTLCWIRKIQDILVHFPFTKIIPYLELYFLNWSTVSLGWLGLSHENLWHFYRDVTSHILIANLLFSKHVLWSYYTFRYFIKHGICQSFNMILSMTSRLWWEMKSSVVMVKVCFCRWPCLAPGMQLMHGSCVSPATSLRSYPTSGLQRCLQLKTVLKTSQLLPCYFSEEFFHKLCV